MCSNWAGLGLLPTMSFHEQEHGLWQLLEFHLKWLVLVLLVLLIHHLLLCLSDCFPPFLHPSWVVSMAYGKHGLCLVTVPLAELHTLFKRWYYEGCKTRPQKNELRRREHNLTPFVLPLSRNLSRRVPVQWTVSISMTSHVLEGTGERQIIRS